MVHEVGSEGVLEAVVVVVETELVSLPVSGLDCGEGRLTVASCCSVIVRVDAPIDAVAGRGRSVGLFAHLGRTDEAVARAVCVILPPGLVGRRIVVGKVAGRVRVVEHPAVDAPGCHVRLPTILYGCRLVIVSQRAARVRSRHAHLGHGALHVDVGGGVFLCLALGGVDALGDFHQRVHRSAVRCSARGGGQRGVHHQDAVARKGIRSIHTGVGRPRRDDHRHEVGERQAAGRVILCRTKRQCGEIIAHREDLVLVEHHKGVELVAARRADAVDLLRELHGGGHLVGCRVLKLRAGHGQRIGSLERGGAFARALKDQERGVLHGVFAGFAVVKLVVLPSIVLAHTCCGLRRQVERERHVAIALRVPLRTTGTFGKVVARATCHGQSQQRGRDEIQLFHFHCWLRFSNLFN